MSRAFTTRDVEAAVRGARKSGLEIGSVEIDLLVGKVVIHVAAAQGVQRKPEDAELEDWLKRNG